MKLIDLKEIAMTRNEFDSVTSRVMQTLRSTPELEDVIAAAKESPYVQERARIDNLIHDAIKKALPNLPAPQGLLGRIKQLLGL
jgi:hypothetical protein